MQQGLTYEQAGVRGLGKDKSRKHFKLLKQTHAFAGRTLVETQFYTLYEASPGVFHVKCSDGVGTKVLLAELAGKHDTIGIDLVASLANDCIRVGAKPFALTNTIDSPNPSKELVLEIQKGLVEGAAQAGCAVLGGETASLSDMLTAPYVLNGDCVGEVREEKIIFANDLKAGDAVIGLRSSGLQCNGISLARHALFRKWGGKYDAWERVEGLDKELVLEALAPSRIYVKRVLELFERVRVKAAAHITGDAYAKFLSAFRNGRIGFEFNNFSPHEIFNVIQRAGKVSDEEMFRRFNMGWGFAVVVAREDADETLQALGEGEAIGRVNESGKVTIEYRRKNIFLE